MDDGIGIWIVLMLIAFVAFVAGMCGGHSCSSDIDLKCKNDGYYHVKFEDDNTDEQIWSKTNRKCKDVATSSDTKSTPISLERPKEESSKPEFDKDW